MARPRIHEIAVFVADAGYFSVMPALVNPSAMALWQVASSSFLNAAKAFVFASSNAALLAAVRSGAL